MAALIGKVSGSRGIASRLGTVSSGISSRLETWNGGITTSLEADGSFTIRIGDKESTGTIVAYGNVDDGKREIKCVER